MGHRTSQHAIQAHAGDALRLLADELRQLPRPHRPCATARPAWQGPQSHYIAIGDPGPYKRVFFRGNRFWAAESHGTESLPTVVLDALVLRGTENDSEIIARLATSRKFRNASMRHRIAILERHVDIDRLLAGYTWETLPTRYLASYIPNEKLQNIDVVARGRAGVLETDKFLQLRLNPSSTHGKCSAVEI